VYAQTITTFIYGENVHEMFLSAKQVATSSHVQQWLARLPK